MKRSIKVCGMLSMGLLMMVATAVAEEIKAHLDGYQETPSTISSTGSGEFEAKILNNGTKIKYKLTYRDTESDVAQSHIHFGRPATSGGIVLFLCTNLTPPAGVPIPPACPPAPGTVMGELTSLDVLSSLPTGQAIDPGAVGFAEILEAIRAGATYVNVHTTNHPGGEIRGLLRDDDRHDHDH